jgi:hypothetical protein
LIKNCPEFFMNLGHRSNAPRVSFARRVSESATQEIW